MSDREKCYTLIDSFDDEQLSNIVALLETAKSLADEAADNAFCQKLHNDYLQDDDKGEPMDLNEFASSLGVQL